MESFFLLFAVSAVVTGFIVNRVETRWALLVMGLVWALTQFPMLGNAGFATIIAARIALGAGEGPAYPVALHSAYKWFPNERRTVPTAIVAQGAGIGIMVALPLLNWVIVRYSWHWAFGVLGIAAVPIMDELRLGPREFGLLGSSFFLLFAVSAVVTGFIVRKMSRWCCVSSGCCMTKGLRSRGRGGICANRMARSKAKAVPAAVARRELAADWLPAAVRRRERRSS